MPVRARTGHETTTATAIAALFTSQLFTDGHSMFDCLARRLWMRQRRSAGGSAIAIAVSGAANSMNAAMLRRIVATGKRTNREASGTVDPSLLAAAAVKRRR